MEEVLTEKLSKLDKFFDTDVEARVAVSATRTTQKIEVTIPLGSGIIRSEVQDEDLYNAADLAVEKLARQLRKYKEKLIRKGHDTIRYENIETPSSDTETMEIVKVLFKKSSILDFSFIINECKLNNILYFPTFHPLIKQTAIHIHCQSLLQEHYPY